MSVRLTAVLVTGILVFAVIFFYYLVKRRLNLKYCLVWILGILTMLVATLFPFLVRWIASLMGIKTPINAVFIIYGFLMLLIVFSLTAIVSHLNNRVFRLVQNQAILEERIRKLEKRNS